MRWINYHSATVNISVFIEQRNIAFQSEISLKTMRFLGVLFSRESWDSRQNRELGRRAVADLFVVFIAWTSQKASKVHKRLSKLAIALIWNIQSRHEDNRPVTPVKCTISAHRGTGTIYDSCRFWYRALSCGDDWFTKGVYIWVRHLHIAMPTITCSLRYE